MDANLKRRIEWRGKKVEDILKLQSEVREGQEWEAQTCNADDWNDMFSNACRDYLN
jgi:hypothetical protein